MADHAQHHGDHGHSHDAHGHGHHHHAIDRDADRRLLWAALLINAGFALAEVVAGLIAGSVALLSDAAHMVTDAGAIAIALVAARLAARPPGGRYTFGLGRSEILSAQLNGVTMLVFAGLIGFEAVGRIVDPPDVDGTLVIVVGVLGAFVNGAVAWILARASRASLNVRGAALHNLADLWSSVGAAIAGVLIVTLGWYAADGLAAMTVCALMVWGGWGLLRDSSRVLLEAAPEGVDPDEIGRALAAQPGVCEVHDLHVWEVTSGFPALAAHVRVPSGDDCHARRRVLQAFLRDTYGLDHVTLQIDHEHTDELVQIEPRPPA
ncbi:cation diffusion facilitator family transporter [Paraconexibacter sp.]|uniref:cation diffusion facilitator family transporter n=1 Tax=Paraconexibacter sp. TaxID=2949640 RepID=UPI003561CC97